MAAKTKQSKTEPETPSRTFVPYSEDPDVVAYQRYREVQKRNGDTIKFADPIERGGGWAEGYSLAQLNADHADGKIVCFPNGKDTVWRRSTRTTGAARKQLAS